MYCTVCPRYERKRRRDEAKATVASLTGETDTDPLESSEGMCKLYCLVCVFVVVGWVKGVIAKQTGILCVCCVHVCECLVLAGFCDVSHMERQVIFFFFLCCR